MLFFISIKLWVLSSAKGKGKLTLKCDPFICVLFCVKFRVAKEMDNIIKITASYLESRLGR